MRNSKDPRYLRLEMVQYAKEHGVKPAARHFQTTPKTVRDWVKRYDGTLDSLAAKSRAPHHCPRKISAEDEARIVELKKQVETVAHAPGKSDIW